MNKTIESVSTDVNKNGLTILKGCLMSVIITLISILVFSFIMSYTDFKEENAPLVIIAISAISILVSSSIATLNLSKNGMLNGGLIGFIYVVVLYLISSSLGAGFSLNLNSIIMIILGIFAGMIGGIVRNKYKKINYV